MKVMSKPASEFVGVGVNTDDEEEASNIDSENEREHQRQNNMLKMGKRDKKKTKESGEKRNRDTNNNIQCQEQRKQQGEATKSTEDCIENVQHKKRDKRTKNNEGSDTSTTLTTFTVKEGAKNMTVGLSTHCSQVHANQMQLHISNIENELRMARHEITIVKTAIGVLPRFTAHSLVANGLVNADQMGNAESVCSAMTKQALHQSNEGSSPPLNNAYTSGNDLAIVVSKGKGIECPFYTSKKKKSTVLKPKKRAATVNGYNLFVRQKMKTADVMAVNDTSSRMLIIAEAWKKLKEENQEEVKRYAKEAQKINESKKSNCGFSNQDEAHSSGVQTVALNSTHCMPLLFPQHIRTPMCVCAADLCVVFHDTGHLRI